MRCIFCLEASNVSRSVEHIIPESLGNKDHVLPPGVVCDKCNNYFASKVEKPFLELPAVQQLRFEQNVLSKRQRIPPGFGMLDLGAPIELIRDHEGLSIVAPEGVKDPFGKTGTLYIPTRLPIPAGVVASRFLAKVGLEAFAHRNPPEKSEGLVYDTQLDPLREHARRGRHPEWPIHVRTIYDQDSMWTDGTGAPYQLIHEFDFLVTDQSEIYFVLCLFGSELVINCGGPELEGYVRWLEAHNGESPLYSGKNESGAKRL